ncbi:MAG TPA: alpha-L-fucosidase, partial [Clostridia bacterium]|nr:alpha-L-fucosidase [Clostridia bacterium]
MNSNLLCKQDYVDLVSSTRDNRMQWWREARFGMFIHYGLYSQWGR